MISCNMHATSMQINKQITLFFKNELVLSCHFDPLVIITNMEKINKYVSNISIYNKGNNPYNILKIIEKKLISCNLHAKTCKSRTIFF
jgi:hypothetical protein